MKVYKQGVSLYVIGTDDANTACKLAGIAPGTHRWTCTDFGMFVRRQGQWRSVNCYSSLKTPKDARPGVAFIGPIRATNQQVAGDPR